MLVIDIPTEKQAVIEQASQLANLSLNEFAVNQLYSASLSLIQQQKSTSENTVPSSSILDKFAGKIRSVGDIVEPVTDLNDWYDERKWADLTS